MFKLILALLVYPLYVYRSRVALFLRNLVKTVYLLSVVEINFGQEASVNRYPTNLRMVEIHESSLPSDENPFIEADFWFSLFTLWNLSRPSNADAVDSKRDVMTQLYSLVSYYRFYDKTFTQSVESSSDLFTVLLSGANYDLDYDLICTYHDNTYILTLKHHEQHYTELRTTRVHPIGEFMVNE